MGTEVDVYAGYGTAAEIFSLGGTGCYYPDQFEDRHLELHFSVGIGPLSDEYSIGEYNTAPASVPYRFFGLTAEHQGGCLTVGSFEEGFDGEYGEAAGYEFTASELDLSIAWVFSTAELLATRNRTLVFGVSKTIGLMLSWRVPSTFLKRRRKWSMTAAALVRQTAGSG